MYNCTSVPNVIVCKMDFLSAENVKIVKNISMTILIAEDFYSYICLTMYLLILKFHTVNRGEDEDFTQRQPTFVIESV